MVSFNLALIPQFSNDQIIAMDDYPLTIIFQQKHSYTNNMLKTIFCISIKLSNPLDFDHT